MEIGSTIRQARVDAGLTQSQLAERAGTSQATVSAYESGAKHPSVGTLSRLLASCGRRLDVPVPAGRPARERKFKERGRILAEVMALAETLPYRAKRELAYPSLTPLADGGAPSPAS